MRRRVAPPIVLLAGLASLAPGACASGPRDAHLDAGPTPDAPLPSGMDARVAPGTDAPVAPGTDAPAAAALALCRLACASSSDCTTASAAFDADNYACTGGACAYTGCNTDDECRSSFADARYVCRDLGTGTRLCTIGCAVAGDCTTASAAYDADNYECVGGACRYLGCNTDDECRSSFADARYVCRATAPAPILPLPAGARNCVLGCAAASDCTTPSAAFDADNYECAGGACAYLGCRSADECRTSFADARYTCR